MSQLQWISQEELAAALNDCTSGLLVIDVRSLSHYNEKHVVGAQCLSFSPILVRRMLKGSISLDTLITDHEMLSALLGATNVVVYDSNSTGNSTRTEFIKITEILSARVSSTGASIRLLSGGMMVFCRKYPNLCCSSKDKSTPSPTSISLDTSAIQKSQEVASPVGTPVEILPHLFLGSAKDSSDIRILQKLNITSVLNITTHCPNHFESQLEYMCIEVEDSHSADLLSKIHQAISYIDAVRVHGGKVFVHCQAGISRSATVCIAYIMQSKKMSLEKAYEFVKSKRPIISPNLNFMGQLMKYQETLGERGAADKMAGARIPTSSHCSLFIATSPCSATAQSPLTTSITAKSHSTTQLSRLENSKHFSDTTESFKHFSDAAAEMTTVSHLTSQLPVDKRPPAFGNSCRSLSVPVETVQRQSRKISREKLRLSLIASPSDIKRADGSPQSNSPCRLEAKTLASNDEPSQSLTLPTTCI